MNVLLYLGVVLFWGSSWFAIKFQLGLIPESVSLAWRFFLASAMLFIFCIIFQKKLKLSLFEFKNIAIQGSANTYSWTFDGLNENLNRFSLGISIYDIPGI